MNQGTCNKPLVELYVNDTLDIELYIEDENGAVFDYTNYEVRFAVFGTAINKVSTNPLDISRTNPAGGLATVHIYAADSAALVVGFAYRFDAEVYKPGEAYTFLRGTFRVL